LQLQTTVILDHNGNPFNGQSGPELPEITAINQLEEAWTPKKLADHNKDYTTLSTSDVCNFDLPGTWRYLRSLYYMRGPVKNVVNNLAMLTGSPEAIEFGADKDAKGWEEIGMANGFPNRWGHIINNQFLYNDYFTAIARGEKLSADVGAKVAIRNIEPFLIDEISTKDHDPESVTGYRSTSYDLTYEPGDVVHHKFNTLGNYVRGVPLLMACLRELTYYYKWMEDLYYIGHIRARLPVVRKIKGGGQDVTTEAARLQYLPGPGRVAVENQGGDWEFPPSYSGLSDAEAGIRVFLQGIALSVNLPVFLVSSDYTNNSLASTLSADSPTVRLIRWYRKQLEAQFKEVIAKSLGYTAASDLEVSFSWPPVIERNKEQDAKAYEIGVRNGAVSAETMAIEVFGLNWEEESKRLRSESDEAERRFGMKGQHEGWVPA